MKIAVTGVKREYQKLPKDYIDKFNKYHLEIPYYFAFYGNDVVITTVDYTSEEPIQFENGSLTCIEEKDFKSCGDFDIVIHWRKFFPEFYNHNAINVINCQDHSFDETWKNTVKREFVHKELYGILCFKGWHKNNLFKELDGILSKDRLIDDLTLGVDTEYFKPNWPVKNPFDMLWASDPGRGLDSAIQLAIQLFQINKSFKLHVCYPDYCKPPQVVKHPAIVWHGNISNGEKLRELFNNTGVLPYTSNFMEPSSRSHRQAQAAGSLVLYPPNMGSPSNLIENGKTGIVEPINTWVKKINEIVLFGEWLAYGHDAREFAISENWEVVTKRFNKYFKEVMEDVRY